jgi:hypothetical protein
MTTFTALLTGPAPSGTTWNENVTYEVGYAHARGLQPLLFTLDPSRITSLPVYFRTLNVHAVSRDGQPVLIRDHPWAAKHVHDDPTPRIPKRAQAWTTPLLLGVLHLPGERPPTERPGGPSHRPEVPPGPGT